MDKKNILLETHIEQAFSNWRKAFRHALVPASDFRIAPHSLSARAISQDSHVFVLAGEDSNPH